jgi:hypothetical protein
VCLSSAVGCSQAKWTRASRDPGEKLGRVVGGYARKVDDTAVSINAPAFMCIPQVQGQHCQGCCWPLRMIRRTLVCCRVVGNIPPEKNGGAHHLFCSCVVVVGSSSMSDVRCVRCP